MSLRTLLVIGLALFCGFSAAIGVSQLATRNESVASEPQTTPVVVTAKAIPRGTPITPELVAVRQWPQEFVPQGAMTDVGQCKDRVAVNALAAGEVLLSTKLAEPGSGRGLAALIPTGMRAYTIKISNVAANVAGFILPGSRVDVLLSLRGSNNDETGGGTTVTLLQAVEVLAVDQDLETADKQPAGSKDAPKQSNSVTLLITPDQAPVLDLGQNMGMLTLALRNPADTVQAKTLPATLSQLRSLQKGVPTRPGQETATTQQQGDHGESPVTMEIRTLRGNAVGRIRVLHDPLPLRNASRHDDPDS